MTQALKSMTAGRLVDEAISPNSGQYKPEYKAEIIDRLRRLQPEPLSLSGNRHVKTPPAVAHSGAGLSLKDISLEIGRQCMDETEDAAFFDVLKCEAMLKRFFPTSQQVPEEGTLEGWKKMAQMREQQRDTLVEQVLILERKLAASQQVPCSGNPPYWTNKDHDWHLWPDNTHHCHACGAIRETSWEIRAKKAEAQLAASQQVDVPKCPICGSKRLQCPEGHAWNI